VKKNKNTPISPSNYIFSVDDDFNEFTNEFVDNEESDAVSVEIDFMGIEPANDTGPWGNI